MLVALETDAPVIKWQHTVTQEIVDISNRRNKALDDGFHSRRLRLHNCINEGLCDGNLVEKVCRLNRDNPDVHFGRHWSQAICNARLVVLAKCP